MPTAEELKKLGNDAFIKKEYKKAAKIYRDAIALDAKNPVLYSNRAICFIKLEDWERAMKDCKTGLELNPDLKTNIKLRYRMGMVYKGLKNYKEAITSFENVLKLDEKNMATKNELDQLLKNSSQKKIKLDNSINTTVKEIPIEVVDVLPEFYQHISGISKPQMKNEENTIKHKTTLKEEIEDTFDFKQLKTEKTAIKSGDLNDQPESKNINILNLLSNLKTVSEDKKVNAYILVIEMDPVEYSKIFSFSVLELEFFEFFLEAAYYVSKTNIIQDWPKKILTLLREFSKTSRFSLTLGLCSRNNINGLLSEVQKLNNHELYSSYKDILG